MRAAASLKFTSRIYRLDHLKLHYLEVPKAVLKKLGDSLKQRLLITVNKSVTWQSGMVAHKKGKACISINQKRMKQAGIKPGQEVDVSLVKDRSKYGLTMPEELKALLVQDTEGNRRFHLLVPGKSRYIIYFVSQLKNKQARVDRAIRVIENLKGTVEGKESFRKILEVKHKNPN